MEADSVRDRLRKVTSRHNSLIKDLRRAFSGAALSEAGYCAIEGVHVIEEAIRSGLKFTTVFFSESASGQASRLLPQFGKHVETLLLPDAVFLSAVATENPQGVAALVKLPTSKFENMVAAENPLVVVAVGIQDPGNLGTILRSAEAFGASGVLLGEKTVSHLNQKVVRASAGSLFRLTIVAMPAAAAAAELRGRGIRLLATTSHRGKPLSQVPLTAATALFIGNEGGGIPRDLLSAMDESLTIPHSSKVESLNAGVAASILLYEAARQRRSYPDQEHKA